MLRVIELASRTDTGRQRNANEDAFLARPPLFAVADGMGGAQAGEVASQLAAESFEGVQRGEESPEAYLRAIAKTANARIHRLAQADSERSGMGTTLTAALVEGEEVGFAHVGDSRAYLLRDGELRLLTSDHSLVEELRRQGRLTDEQAEDHPQRSIITRGEGPARDVEVDTRTYGAKPGGVYLLCADGLTTMIREDRIKEILSEAASLEDAVTRLVAEANEAGGRDNITVVAFRLEEAEVAEAVERPTLVGPAAEEAGLAAAGAPAAAEVARRRPTRPDTRRRRLRAAAKVVGAVAISVALAAVAVWGVRQVYFLGSDAGGRVALYRGLPYDLPFDIKLYSEVYAAPVQVASLPAERRDSATNHTLRFHDDAVDLVESLQSDAERSSNGRAATNAGRRVPESGHPARRTEAGGRVRGRGDSGNRTRRQAPGGGGGSG